MRTRPHGLTTAAAAVLTLLAAACSKDGTTPPAAAGTPEVTQTSNAELDSIVLPAAPADAVDIVPARAASKPGDTVVVKGFVGGRLDPFVEGRAVLVLADPNKLIACNKIPGDECETPWDVCCDTPEAIAAATATVQIVDGSGEVLKGNLKGLSGIRELSDLIVTGTVDRSSTAGAFIVNATGIYVQPPTP